MRLLSEQSCLEFVEEARKAVMSQPLSEDLGQHLETCQKAAEVALNAEGATNARALVRELLLGDKA